MIHVWAAKTGNLCIVVTQYTTEKLTVAFKVLSYAFQALI